MVCWLPIITCVKVTQILSSTYPPHPFLRRGLRLRIVCLFVIIAVIVYNTLVRDI